MLLERLLENLALDLEAFALCRVAPGWRLRLPPLDWVTFHFVVQGRGEGREAGGEWRTLAPGSVLLVPPHLGHSLRCGAPPHAEEETAPSRSWAGLPEHLAGPEEVTGLVVVCGRARVLYGGGLGVFDHLRESLLLDFAGEPTVATLFETMLGEVRRPRPGTRAMIGALMDEFLVHVFRRVSRDGDGHVPWLQGLDAPELSGAVTAMLERPGEPHSVATLAALCHMSRSTFASRFRSSFGRPPMDYLREVRLRRAARLLRQDPPPPVALVAHRVGFGSRSQFSRAFKELFHTPPSGFGPRSSRSEGAEGAEGAEGVARTRWGGAPDSPRQGARNVQNARPQERTAS